MMALRPVIPQQSDPSQSGHATAASPKLPSNERRRRHDPDRQQPRQFSQTFHTDGDLPGHHTEKGHCHAAPDIINDTRAEIPLPAASHISLFGAQRFLKPTEVFILDVAESAGKTFLGPMDFPASQNSVLGSQTL